MGKFVNVDNSKRGDGSDYGDVIRRIAERGECPFCRENLYKEHKKPILAEGKSWIVTESSWPYKHSRDHLLFIHSRHITDVRELTIEDFADLQELLERVRQERGIEGGALMMRFGNTEWNGASVSHLHAHLVTGDPTKPKGEREPVLARIG